MVIRENIRERKVLPNACSKRLLNHNILPNEFVYTTLIDEFITNENFDGAKNILKFLDGEDVRVEIIYCNATIKGY